ncbi:MAG: alpha/beta fold hydrolase [Phycisphaerales bacterium]|nr:alpha/beta fold hydrolase [Phycisphaerales bacterium]
MAKPPKPKSILKRITRTLRWTLIVLLLALLGVRFSGAAEQLAYFPSRHLIVTPAEYEDLWITTPDGLKLHAWFMPAKRIPENQRAPAILHAHGNAGNIADHDTFSNFLTDAGFHVLLFDYRCYGRSDDTGPINRNKLAIDTAAALEALFNHPRVDPTRVGVLGVSLGGPFALNAAANEPRVRAIATLSTFSSWQGVAADMSPLGPLLMPSGLDAKDSIKHLSNQPYLIMHGTNDQVINPRHADILYKAATDAQVSVTLKTYPGDHNSLIQRSAQARADLIEFFQTHLEPLHSVGDNETMFRNLTNP